MPYDLSNYLVIGISSRALFDLTEENMIFETKGLEEFTKYQIENEDNPLKPGIGFSLVNGLLRLNSLVNNERKTEVIVMSKNNPDTSLRIFNSIDHYNVDITRAALTSGRSLVPYLKAFNVDLFLSADEDDVQDAIDSGIAAGLIYESSASYHEEPLKEIKIAFDGDAVLFSDESEKIYKEKGLDAFVDHERINARKPLPEGPFAKLLRTLSFLQKELKEENPIRTALVTARSSPAHERVIRTLRAWGIRIDEAFFLGGAPKKSVLKAFGAHIFFDDQEIHLSNNEVPSARVPYKSEGKHSDFEENNKHKQ